MRRPFILAAALLLGVSTVVAPSPASAAGQQFGHGCTANGTNGDLTYVMVAGAASNLLPVGAPSAGVITQARFVLPPAAAGDFPQKLKVVRPTGQTNEYAVTAETGRLSMTAGTTTVDVRLPVAAGELLGIAGGETGTVYCATGSADDVVAQVAGDSPVGAPVTYTTLSSTAIPVVATVEPDADKDGYGDLTQDACPRNDDVQTACPALVLDSFGVAQGKKILVLVGTSESTSVKVTGAAKLGGGSTVKLSSRPKRVSPGAFGRFTLRLPKALREALAALPPNRSIKVKLVATTTDLDGRKVTDKTSVKLPGTG